MPRLPGVTIIAGVLLALVVETGQSFAQAVAPSPAPVQTAQNVPRKAPPLPPKPVPLDETAKEARANAWTIGVAGGLLEGTFIRYAADLAKVLDDGDNLRVLPLVSYGAVGNVSDLIYLKGVDLAITYADALDHFRTTERIPNIDRRVNYIIPMFQGEVHIYAGPEIKSIADLAGKKVNFNTVGSAANYTGGIVFDRLGITVERLFQNNAVALEAVHRGEIAALVHVVGKPNDLFSRAKPPPGFRFLPIDFTDVFKDFYVPAELTNADYPALVEKGKPVSTISVPALLAVYNWRNDTDRYRRIVRFVEYLFDRFDRLRQPPYQTGWRDVNLAGTVPGWTRFAKAQELVDRATQRPAAAGGVDPVLARAQAARAAPNNTAEQERLFQQFLEWSRQQKRQ